MWTAVESQRTLQGSIPEYDEETFVADVLHADCVNRNYAVLLCFMCLCTYSL